MARAIIQTLHFRQPAEDYDLTELGNLLEQAYLAQSSGTKERKKETFAPSAIAYGHGTCPRYWYLAFNGCEMTDTVDAMGMANMMNGSAAHERIQKMFEETGTLVSAEVEVKMANPPIRGFIDLMIRWNDEIVIGEVKTAKQESFLFRQNSMKPTANHLIQLLIYLKATGKRRGFFFYENKNTQEYLIIPVELTESNEKIIEDVFGWLREVYQTYENETLPERPFSKRNKICKNCPVFAECWERQPEGVIAVAPMEVPKI